MEPIYLIGGLGVDERVFVGLNFRNYEKRVIKWIEPSKNESLPDYCKRLLTQIPSNNPIILGVSFGAIVANEIAKQIPVKQIIIVSSIRSAKEMPWYFKFAGRVGLHRIISKNLAIKTKPILGWIFSIKNTGYRKTLDSIISEMSGGYLKWSLNQIVKWQGEEQGNTIQIHGKDDRLFPIRYIKHPNLILNNSGHFMIAQRSEEISGYIDGLGLV